MYEYRNFSILILYTFVSLVWLLELNVHNYQYIITVPLFTFYRFFYIGSLMKRVQDECWTTGGWNYLHLLFSSIFVAPLWRSQKAKYLDNFNYLHCLVFFISHRFCTSTGCLLSKYIVFSFKRFVYWLEIWIFGVRTHCMQW